MNMKTIRHLAKTLSIEPGKLSKTELIKKIQVAEGNFDCYGSAINGECDQLDCVWRDDCLSESSTAAAEAL
ncbi:MAG: SAP domain-containing protein [Betaproteobacteria bacterium HGW-Betaproteobacteria-18]|nr:MAG: SAP domain-containing protein [Betaproteobacteria bacterium HGW-Betaproteobacteria-18]